jgi:hypothetical protein
MCCVSVEEAMQEREGGEEGNEEDKQENNFQKATCSKG